MTRTPRSRVATATAGVTLFCGLVSILGSTQKVEKLSRNEVKALIATAKSANDHKKLAAYYRDEAAGLVEKQREHEEDLKEYQANSSQYGSKYPTMGDHCRGLAGFYGMAAEKALALAHMHDRLAKDVSGEASPK